MPDMMNDRSRRLQPPADAGQCAACRHARVIESDRGSRFVQCDRSRVDPRYPRYPHLPVTDCAGQEPPGVG
jgi:hypothetical protein